MMELADMQDLGSCAVRRAGSTPVIRTTSEGAPFYGASFNFEKSSALTGIALFCILTPALTAYNILPAKT